MNTLHSTILKVIVMAAMITFASGCSKAPEEEKLNINFEKYTMPNGLQVVLQPDHSDPMISYAIMYHAGSSREIPGRTGFAHLFEHLLFGGSENVPAGKFDKVIEAAGGMNNGFTTRDVTTYFEVIPKNALEKILWLESDRMGFFINSITPRLMAIQQNVVQNEKRQSEDNSPYGFTEYVIDKNLYPQNHPYNWEVIGEMEDLKNATLDDVKNYYNKFYGPNNATLVLSGDFNPDSVKILLNKYFGEIKPHGEAAPRTPMTVSLDQTRKLYHEDNFANVPELTMVWPAPQSYTKDSYALEYLARLLAEGKNAPLYKVLVKEKQLTSEPVAYYYPSELAGEFTIKIRANEGKSLKDIENAVNEALAKFEKEGITQKDVERIKATSERNFYNGLTSVLNKSLQLAFYNTYLNDPGYIQKDLDNIKAVTLDDIKSAYDKYIKGKNFVETSFVPKGETNLIADNAIKAVVNEESISQQTQVPIANEGSEEIKKTPSSIDRSAEPPAGKEPEAKIPEIWTAVLSNGIRVYGIENKEMPLVNVNIAFNGGVSQDKLDLPGVASMVAAIMPQGTKTKTPEELEDAIQLLGSDISMYTGPDDITMSGGMLSRNFEQTVSLMREILFEPRWDTTEFRIAKTSTINDLIQAEAQPARVGSSEFYKVSYGDKNIFGYDSKGTQESVKKITIDDLKAYYDRCISPSETRILIAGNIGKEKALEALTQFVDGWNPKEVSYNDYPVPPEPETSRIYFVDMPGSRQSVIYAGYPSISRENPDYIKADFVNYRLGGAFTSILNQILREERGYTYGAHSTFREMKTPGPFMIWTSVRSDATYESLRIIRDELEKYRKGISPDDLQFVKNCMIRSDAMRFETNNALVGMLSTMTRYNLPQDYIRKEENVIRNMTVEENKATTDKYINPDRMYYVVVGDAATQMQPLEKIGFGKPVLVKK